MLRTKNRRPFSLLAIHSLKFTKIISVTLYTTCMPRTSRVLPPPKSVYPSLHFSKAILFLLSFHVSHSMQCGISFHISLSLFRTDLELQAFKFSFIDFLITQINMPVLNTKSMVCVFSHNVKIGDWLSLPPYDMNNIYFPSLFPFFEYFPMSWFFDAMLPIHINFLLVDCNLSINFFL